MKFPSTDDIEELRRMARSGARTRDYVEEIRRRVSAEEDGLNFPVVVFLHRAFPISLRTVRQIEGSVFFGNTLYSEEEIDTILLPAISLAMQRLDSDPTCMQPVTIGCAPACFLNGKSDTAHDALPAPTTRAMRKAIVEFDSALDDSVWDGDDIVIPLGYGVMISLKKEFVYHHSVVAGLVSQWESYGWQLIVEYDGHRIWLMNTGGSNHYWLAIEDQTSIWKRLRNRVNLDVARFAAIVTDTIVSSGLGTNVTRTQWRYGYNKPL